MKKPNGYLVNLYQYARQYRYNGEQCRNFFNYLLEKREKLGVEKYTLLEEYITFGEFDLLQIIPICSFWEYHETQELAKDWFGRRQSVLLYDISQEENPVRICFDPSKRIWKDFDGEEETPDDNSSIKREEKFLCLSMLSLTNEAIEETNDLLPLQRELRTKILSIVDQINKQYNNNIRCEVFGTFNTAELAIIWLSDQYVDILQTVDYIKQIKVIEKETNGEDGKEIPAFFSSFSTIAIKETIDPQGILGDALVQIAVHDLVNDYDELQKIACEIILNKKLDEDTPTDGVLSKENVQYSVGEYDIVIKLPASDAVKLFIHKTNGYLSLNIDGEGRFSNEDRKILRSNTRLLYSESQTSTIKQILKSLYSDKEFILHWNEKFDDFKYVFEVNELEETVDKEEISNADYYMQIRDKLRKQVSPSAGVVDTLDLMYADYNSVISTAYSALWVTDLHRQFKSVLHAIDLMLTSSEMGWSWDWYLDLTNAFKQQIYHLTQSSRMFFEIPTCHLRSTGQYDLLMHAYYGATKKILEVIYRIQGISPQSELIPLITVNTVPQVKTQMYFEVGDNDSRTINLDIPNSIIFDIQRGICYITHELFHYAAPWNRKERNYRMGIFLAGFIFERQFSYVLQRMLSTREDGTIDPQMQDVVKDLFYNSGDEERSRVTAEYYNMLNQSLFAFIEKNFNSRIFPFVSSQVDGLSSNYQYLILSFIESDLSQPFYEELFLHLLPLCRYFLRISEAEFKNSYSLHKVKERIQFCLRNLGEEEYVINYVRSNAYLRFIDHDLKRHSSYAISIWSSVREVCSDIAMVSINGLSLCDYMLFCIQAWTDSNIDSTAVLQKMNGSACELEKIRFALVSFYFYRNKNPKWSEYDDQYCLNLNNDTKAQFVDRFVNVQIQNKMRNPHYDIRSANVDMESLRVQANTWLQFFFDSSQMYLRGFSFYYNILEPVMSDFDIDKRIKALKDEKRYEDKNYIVKIISIFKNGVRDNYTKLFSYPLIDLANSCFNKQLINSRFDFDIRTVNTFRNQRSLNELGLLNKRIQEKAKIISHKKYNPTILFNNIDKLGYDIDENECVFYVYSLNELLFYLKYCTCKLETNSKSQMYQLGQRNVSSIWFRGSSNVNYLQIPTLMHNYTTEKQSRYISLRSYQQYNFEEFKFRADGGAEMPVGMKFTLSDYIAMMRHYEVSTNFLDWTENAFTSLYFALRPYFEDKSSEEVGVNDVSLSIFHPGIYNRIRLNCLEQLKSDAGNHLVDGLDPSFTSVLRNKSWYTTLVPNLSTHENELIYNMFLLGNIDTDAFYMKDKSDPSYKAYLDTCNTDARDLFMPLAILTSRLNPRIKTQYGCFVAYNLYTPGNPADKYNPYDYISLDEIQDRKREQGIFMYKIIIDKTCCPEVANWLRSMGLSQESVYPELSEKIVRLIEDK